MEVHKPRCGQLQGSSLQQAPGPHWADAHGVFRHIDHRQELRANFPHLGVSNDHVDSYAPQTETGIVAIRQRRERERRKSQRSERRYQDEDEDSEQRAQIVLLLQTARRRLSYDPVLGM